MTEDVTRHAPRDPETDAGKSHVGGGPAGIVPAGIVPAGIVVVIPARGGSVGIPRKNIASVAGRPLISWTIEAGLAASLVDAVVVATDDDEIASVAEACGASVFRRSAASATSTAPSEQVVAEVVLANPGIEAVVLVQATSPLTTGDDIDRCVRAWSDRGSVGSIVSVVRSHRFRWDPEGNPLNYDPAHRPRRQDWDGELIENGAIYVSGPDAYTGAGNRCVAPVSVVEMDPATLVEIDEPVDLVIVAALLDARIHGKQAPV